MSDSGFVVAGFLDVQVRADGSAEVEVGPVPISLYEMELRSGGRRVSSPGQSLVGVEGARVSMRSAEGTAKPCRGVISESGGERPRSLLTWQQDAAPRWVPVTENGEFEVSLQPDRPATLCAGDFHRGALVGTGSGFAAGPRATVLVDTGEDGTPLLQLDCVRAADLSGRVVDGEGRPLTSRTVQLEIRDGRPEALFGISVYVPGGWTQTDEDGRFRFPALPVGTNVRLSLVGGDLAGVVERELDENPGTLELIATKGLTLEGLVPSGPGNRLVAT